LVFWGRSCIRPLLRERGRGGGGERGAPRSAAPSNVLPSRERRRPKKKGEGERWKACPANLFTGCGWDPSSGEEPFGKKGKKKKKRGGEELGQPGIGLRGVSGPPGASRKESVQSASALFWFQRSGREKGKKGGSSVGLQRPPVVATAGDGKKKKRGGGGGRPGLF